jgi:hypothetical protein
MNLPKEIVAKNIHERCLLMARSEADVICQRPQLGEEIYKAWTESMNAASPDDFELFVFVQELTDKYKVEQEIVCSLLEDIRQIIVRYDELIDIA